MITLDDLKNYLNITYTDQDVDAKLAGILARADKYVRSRTSAAANDTLTETEEQLVYDACRYMFNDAFEDFEGNYMHILTAERAARQVAAAESEEENAG